MSFSTFTNCKALRENEETCRAGFKWTAEEDEQLMKDAIYCLRRKGPKKTLHRIL